MGYVSFWRSFTKEKQSAQSGGLLLFFPHAKWLCHFAVKRWRLTARTRFRETLAHFVSREVKFPTYTPPEISIEYLPPLRRRNSARLSCRCTLCMGGISRPSATRFARVHKFAQPNQRFGRSHIPLPKEREPFRLPLAAHEKTRCFLWIRPSPAASGPGRWCRCCPGTPRTGRTGTR